MACEIVFKEHRVQLNNRQFAVLMVFGLEVAEDSAGQEEKPFVARMMQLNKSEFWPGRGIDIAIDFPDLAERKFWSRMFFEVARSIFERKIGIHDDIYWQAQAIHQAYATGLVFQDAVRETEPQWSADTTDRREFDRVVNKIDRTKN